MSSDALGWFAEAVAADPPGPAGGSAAAAAVAIAAALAELAARKSERPDEEARAAALRTRAVSLADADARAYAEVVGADGQGRRDALDRSSAILHEIADAAAEVATLAAPLAASGKATLRPDAAASVELAEAARRIAEQLAEANE